MKKGHFLFSAIEFLFTAMLILLGIFCIGIGYVPTAYAQLITFLSQSSSLFLGGGVLLLAAGILLLIVFCTLHSRQYYQIRFLPHPVEIDVELIRQSIGEYLTTLEVKVGCEVWMEEGKIQVGLSTEGMQEQERQNLMTLLKRQLPALLQQQMGYDQPLIVSVLYRS